MNPPRLLVLLVLLASPASAPAGPEPDPLSRNEQLVVLDAAAILRDASRADLDQPIPPEIFRRARGVAVIPRLFKAGFIVGGEHGRGVLTVRKADGTWSAPIFLQMTGGSLGFQAGAQASELVLVFTTAAGVERLLAGRNKLTLGADIGVAAGPVGREIGAATDPRLRAEILTYARSRGLFAGVSVAGAALTIDWRSNAMYYRTDFVSPAEILRDPSLPLPPSAPQFTAQIELLAGGPLVEIVEGDPSAPVVRSRPRPAEAPGFVEDELPVEPLAPPPAAEPLNPSDRPVIARPRPIDPAPPRRPAAPRPGPEPPLAPPLDVPCPPRA